MIRALPALALLLVLFGNTTDAAKKDLEMFQGEWVLAALEVNGVDVPENKLDGSVLTVKDDSYVVKRKDQSTRVKITLDPSKDPKEIDMLFLDGANRDKVQKGIYKFKNDGHFMITRGLSPDQNRPRDFATWPDSGYFVMTWKPKP